MARSRPLKKRRTQQSRYQMAKQIESIFTSKLSLTYDLVDVNNDAVDGIMLKARTDPTRENFLNAVDFVNMLTILLYSHDDKAYAHTGCDVPDGYLWLVQKGYQDITGTVNRTQDGLLRTFRRGKETGSYALDGDTMKGLLECAEMYKEMIEIMPIRVLQTALATLRDMSGSGTVMPFLKLGNNYGCEVETNQGGGNMERKLEKYLIDNGLTPTQAKSATANKIVNLLGQSNNKGEKMFKEIGKIYETTDYSIFKTLQGNRQVSDLHVNKIIKSFNTVGRRVQPITVNFKMEIIDGQGRFEACKRLGLSVYFVFDEDAGINECIAMNINQTNWKLIDYIRSFAEQGKPAYQKVMYLIKTFNKIPIQVILAVSRGSATEIRDTHLKEGAFEFKISYDEAKKELEVINSFLDIPVSGRTDVFCLALHFLYRRLNFNMDALLQKLQANYQKLVPFSDIPECLTAMSDVWNFRTSKNRVYWQTEYDKIITQKSRWKNKN